MGTKMDLTNQLNDSDLTLEEKLAAIDAMLETKEVVVNGKTIQVAVDPADATVCIGCQ